MNNTIDVSQERFSTNQPQPPSPFCELRQDRVAEICGISNDMLAPAAAAVELLPKFRRLARALCPRDKSTQDDLVQTMALAALDCNEPHTVSFYCSLGVWRAQNYLIWWFGPMLGRWPGREDTHDSAAKTAETREAVLDRASA